MEASSVMIGGKSASKIILGGATLWEGAREYEVLEWLESDGDQWIDTGMYPEASGYRADGKIRWVGVQKSWAAIMGGGHNGTSTNPANNKFGRLLNTNCWTMTDGSDARSTQEWAENVDYEFEVSFIPGEKFLKINGETVISSANAGSPFTDKSVLLFTYNRSHALTAETFKGRFYCVRMFDFGSTPVRSFLPCRRIADGAVGMYDTVTKTFFANQGTGSFVPGPATGRNF